VTEVLVATGLVVPGGYTEQGAEDGGEGVRFWKSVEDDTDEEADDADDAGEADGEAAAAAVEARSAVTGASGLSLMEDAADTPTADGPGSRGPRGASSRAAALRRLNRRFLSYAEILQLGNNTVDISKRGYEFLLKETGVQLWTFTDQYLRTAARKRMEAGATAGGGGGAGIQHNASDVLSFLFQLGYCTLGRGYAIRALTDAQRAILADFASFGLVYVPKGRRGEHSASIGGSATEPLLFYPTPLSIVMTRPGASGLQLMQGVVAMAEQLSGAMAEQLSGAGGGGGGLAPSMMSAPSAGPSGGGVGALHLIVEKNFKVYAYTDLNLHMGLLDLFCRVEARLPNLVICRLTHHSVLKAVEKGISASLIKDFLSRNIHPAMRARRLGVPDNVVDQLYLWEQERGRVRMRRGVLFDGFIVKDEYSELKQYLEGLGEAHMRALIAKRREARKLRVQRGDILVWDAAHADGAEKAAEDKTIKDFDPASFVPGSSSHPLLLAVDDSMILVVKSRWQDAATRWLATRRGVFG
jgi:hypothetical protein